jgi:hypothetical protein
MRYYTRTDRFQVEKVQTVVECFCIIFLFKNFLLSNSSNYFLINTDNCSAFIDLNCFFFNFVNSLFLPRISWIIIQSETQWVMWERRPVTGRGRWVRRRRKDTVTKEQVVLTLSSWHETFFNTAEESVLANQILKFRPEWFNSLIAPVLCTYFWLALGYHPIHLTVHIFCNWQNILKFSL